MIFDSVQFLVRAGKTVFFDAEHFFDGYAANPRYALETLEAARSAGAEFLVLCDTNGGTLPEDIRNAVAEVCKRYAGPRGHPLPQRQRRGRCRVADRGAHGRDHGPGHRQRPGRALRQRGPGAPSSPTSC